MLLEFNKLEAASMVSFKEEAYCQFTLGRQFKGKRCSQLINENLKNKTLHQGCITQQLNKALSGILKNRRAGQGI